MQGARQRKREEAEYKKDGFCSDDSMSGEFSEDQVDQIDAGLSSSHDTSITDHKASQSEMQFGFGLK